MRRIKNLNRDSEREVTPEALQRSSLDAPLSQFSHQKSSFGSWIGLLTLTSPIKVVDIKTQPHF